MRLFSMSRLTSSVPSPMCMTKDQNTTLSRSRYVVNKCSLLLSRNWLLFHPMSNIVTLPNTRSTFRSRSSLYTTLSSKNTSRSRSRFKHSLGESISRYVIGNVINGKIIANDIQHEIKEEVNKLIEKDNTQRLPHLSVILVGNDPASSVYVRNKAKAAQKTGISCDILSLPHDIPEKDIIHEIDLLNKDPSVDGIIVQLPLSPHLNERLICDTVLPQKDVDGFHVLNVGRFCVDQPAFMPATPSGVLEIIKRLELVTKGKNAVICGRSKNVGLPVALNLQSSGKDSFAGDATITICHRHTPADVLKFHAQHADILVTATGIPGLITSDMVKEGAVVIDIGITRIKDKYGNYKLTGDVDFEGVKPKASLITPVPGGVGPVTVAMVIYNTLAAYKKEIDFNTMKI